MSTTEHPKKPRKGDTCIMCHEAKYTETTIHDDWDGVYHCPKCGASTNHRPPQHSRAWHGFMCRS